MKLTLICFLVVLLQFAACAPKKSRRTEKPLEPASDVTSVNDASSSTITRKKKQNYVEEADSDEDKYVVAFTFWWPR
jgi:hypothetical protein